MASLKRLALILFVLVTSVFSYADELIVGVETTDYSPYYKGDGAEYSGFGRELLDLFAEKYHHTVTYKKMDVPELLQAMLNKQIDLKFPDDAQWASDKRKGRTIYYSKPAVVVTEGMMVLKENVGKGIGAIGKIGTVRGFSAIPYLPYIADKKMTLIESHNFSGLVKAGVMKVVDGIYISPVICNYYLKTTVNNPGLLEFDKSLPSAKSTFGVSSAKREDVVKQFDEFLSKYDGQIEKLKEKHGITN